MPTVLAARASRAAVFIAAIGSAIAIIVGVAAAANPFVDINGNQFAGDIDAIYNAGVTLGCDTTHYCPGDPVKRDQMAAFLARSAGLSSASTKRFPITNARSAQQTFCSLYQSSPRAYEAGPCQGSALDVDAGGVGSGTATAIGLDGLPIIGYFDAKNGDLKVAHCASPACTNATVISSVDSNGVVGRAPSIAVGADGLPLVSYYDVTNGDLKVAHCVNVDCAGNITTISVLDGAGDVGQFSSIAIGADGVPVIAYFDATNGDLKVARCSATACTAATKAVLDAAGVVGQYPSLAIGADGIPIVSYFDATHARLKLVRCADASCKAGTAPLTLDPSSVAGQFSSMTIGVDGLPVLAYYDSGATDLKVLHCGNPACTTNVSVATVDFQGDVGKYASIAIGTDGFPVVAFYRTDGANLRLAKCSNTLCSSSVLRGLDTAGDVGSFASIAIGPDAIPVVAYQDAGSGILKVARPPAA